MEFHERIKLISCPSCHEKATHNEYLEQGVGESKWDKHFRCPHCQVKLKQNSFMLVYAWIVFAIIGYVAFFNSRTEFVVVAVVMFISLFPIAWKGRFFSVVKE